MSPPRAILFDLDETLLDRSASLREFVTWQATRQLRPDIDDVARFVHRFIELDANGRVWKDEVYTRLREEFALASWSVEELLASYELCFPAFARAREGVEGVVETLAARGLALGLVSNGRTPFQERNFRALGMAHRFDAVVVSAAVGFRKPDAAIFELACTRLGVTPGEAVFVGDDAVSDIAGARAAGLRAVHVPYDAYVAAAPDAHATVRNLEELPSLIERLR